jgi:hypothetical protein
MTKPGTEAIRGSFFMYYAGDVTRRVAAAFDPRKALFMCYAVDLFGKTFLAHGTKQAGVRTIGKAAVPVGPSSMGGYTPARSLMIGRPGRTANLHHIRRVEH